jgi:thioredoxin-like negative regulator of GroEL
MSLSSFAGLALLLLGVLAASTPAVALEQVAFDVMSFKAALRAGKPVVVHISAPWCPTCWAQHLVIDTLAIAPEYDSITIYQVDFDGQKDVVRSFRATQQSTLIAFHGAREMGRTVGDASVEGISALLAGSLK